MPRRPNGRSRRYERAVDVVNIGISSMSKSNIWALGWLSTFA
jgi:hypothetical protein